MKSRTPLLSTLAASALLFAGALLAQDAPPPLPPSPPVPSVPATPPAAAAPVAAPAAQAGVYQTPQGEVTVHSAPAPAPAVGPAPPFEQLSGGKKAITEEQAIAYLPLANDFIHADSNRNNSISKPEYEGWVKQL